MLQGERLVSCVSSVYFHKYVQKINQNRRMKNSKCMKQKSSHTVEVLHVLRTIKCGFEENGHSTVNLSLLLQLFGHKLN